MWLLVSELSISPDVVSKTEPSELYEMNQVRGHWRNLTVYQKICLTKPHLKNGEIKFEKIAS